MLSKLLRYENLLLVLCLAILSIFLLLGIGELQRRSQFAKAEHKLVAEMELLEYLIRETEAKYAEATSEQIGRVHAACLRDGTFALCDSLAEQTQARLTEMIYSCPLFYTSRVARHLEYYTRLNNALTRIQIPFAFRNLQLFVDEDQSFIR